MLGDVGRGAAVLAAEREALGEAQGDEERRGGESPARVAREESDQGGPQAHRRHRDEERVLATDQVAEVAEHERAEWTDAESGAERGEAGEELGGVVSGGKEEAPEKDRETSVEIEVVPLEQRPERRREDDPPERR